VTANDRTGRGDAARSARSERPLAGGAPDGVVRSMSVLRPFCAVECGQHVFVPEGRIRQIEGDPDSPISLGKPCPKGGASKQYMTRPDRVTTVRYRRPGGGEWEDPDLDTAMQMIAAQVLETRRRTWQDRGEEGRPLRRAMGIAHLGGATMDNEENYLIKKLYTAVGTIQVETRPVLDTAPLSPV
jgi:formate dehydrogenase major subunit